MTKKKGRIKTGSLGRTTVILLLLLVVIVGSLFFVGGVIPKTTHTNLGGDPYTPITTITTDSHANLQLKTIKFKSCTSSAAIGFLVDQSGSMEFGTKENNLKYALNVFAGSFPQEGIIGLRTYSDEVYRPIVVPFDYYRNNKPQIENAIRVMRPYSATHSRDAFIEMKKDIDAARAKFPQQTLNLVFISDGIPETGVKNEACTAAGGPASDPTYCGANPRAPAPACRCFDTNQDPTDIAAEIKNSGVRIFTIRYIDKLDDVKFQNILATLMTNVASSPGDAYIAPFENDLIKIFEQISTKLCEETK